MTDKERIDNHFESIIELSERSLSLSERDGIRNNALAILHDVTRIMSIIEGEEMYGRILPQPNKMKGVS